jgi:pantetheine-phosphate adenylyltransferase
VAANADKQPMFTQSERKRQITAAVKSQANVEVASFKGLLVDFADQHRAQAIIRGLRAVSDFEFEFQLALMNRKLNEEIETIFMMPRESYTFLSSRLVKEIAGLGGDISAFVPTNVERALRRKLKP